MYNTVEYTYENRKRHLNDDEALEAYNKAVKDSPGAIVELRDLDCGHWDVVIYKTPEQKETFYRKRINRMYRNLLSRLRK